MAVATDPHDFALLPGAAPDPEPKSTAYFVLWGFALVLLIIIALQYFVAAVVHVEQGDKARGSLELRQLKARQLHELEQGGEITIDEAMRRVAQEYRR